MIIFGHHDHLRAPAPFLGRGRTRDDEHLRASPQRVSAQRVNATRRVATIVPFGNNTPERCPERCQEARVFRGGLWLCQAAVCICAQVSAYCTMARSHPTWPKPTTVGAKPRPAMEDRRGVIQPYQSAVILAGGGYTMQWTRRRLLGSAAVAGTTALLGGCSSAAPRRARQRPPALARHRSQRAGTTW